MTPPSGGAEGLGLAPAAAAIVLGAARTLPLAWVATPLAAGGPASAPARLGLGLALAALAAPAVSPALPLDRSGFLFFVWLAREAMVGLVMGLVVSFAFRAAEAAGRLTDTLRGANVADIISPSGDERSSPLGVLYLLLAAVVFFEIGGVPRLGEAIARSYDALPAGGGGLDAVGAGRAALVVAAASARLIESALALAAPAIVAIWLTDLTLAFVARAVPGMPVYFLGLPLKGLFGVGIVLVALSGLEAALARGLGGWLALLGRAVASLAP